MKKPIRFLKPYRLYNLAFLVDLYSNLAGINSLPGGSEYTLHLKRF